MARNIFAHPMALGLLGAACLLPALAAGPAQAQTAATCEIDRPVVLAGLDYDSAAFHNAVASRIISTGFGCEVDAIPGQVIALVNGLARGDLDIVMEIWEANPVQPWVDGLKENEVVSLGVNFPDAIEGWFVPRYVVEGAAAPAKDLESVADLPRFKELFADPEEPGKGRFLNCLPGWQCEVINSKKLQAYGLTDAYTNFRPGSGEALTAAVESAILRERPILFYYWGPTWLLGKYDLAQIEEPPFDAQIWQAMLDSENPTKATAYPVSKVIIGANAEFAKQAPQIAGFLEKYETTGALVSRMLAYMRDNKASADDAARHFLQTETGWTAWVPADVAQRVRAAL